MLAAKHVPGNMPALTQTKPITTAAIADGHRKRKTKDGVKQSPTKVTSTEPPAPRLG